MAHTQERTTWLKEGLFGLLSGTLYGTTSVVIGHPLDTIKTKMQAQPGYEKLGMVKASIKTVKSDGFIGLYRGAIPPMIGSGIYRSVQFAVFEAAYTYLESPGGNSKIPFTGIDSRILIGGFLAGTTRTFIECPLEYIKVRKQTNKPWQFKHSFRGFNVTWGRNIGLLTYFFMFLDVGRRNLPKSFTEHTASTFIMSGAASTISWWIVWPLEVLKSKYQSDHSKSMSVVEGVKDVMKHQGGFVGLYRGITPGSLRSFVANGLSMMAMTYAQKKITDLGFRN